MPGNTEKFLTKFAQISAVAFSVLPHISWAVRSCGYLHPLQVTQHQEQFSETDCIAEWKKWLLWP